MEPSQGEKLSKNQLKKLAKQKKKEEEKKQKEQQKNDVKEENNKNEKLIEITDPQEFYKNRCTVIKKLKEDKEYFPYPHKWQITDTLPKIVDKYDKECTENGKFFDDKIVSVAGRLNSIRAQSKKLYFLDVISEGVKIQVMVNLAAYGDDEEFHKILQIIKRGDYVGISGPIGRTKKGELSIKTNKIKLLSPCLRMLPQARYGLNDQETRYRQRYLDLIVNANTKKIFQTRAKIIKSLRRILDERDFMEVETPVLNMKVGGAAARPFKTFHNDLKLDMVMRVAPELFLKKCIIGGIDRVYEIGKNFRNEGIDHTHNPEFTACELYWAYADYKDLMELTEEILCTIIMEVKGSLKFEVKNEQGEKKTLDFTRPWKRISMMEELEKNLECELPNDLSLPEANKFFDEMCKKHEVKCNAPRSTKRLINKLVEHFIEDRIVNPSFLIEQPQLMCPLAKYHRDKPGLTERFELFIDGKEFVNAYTELNDPFVQLELFEEQAESKKEGDLEANDVDEDFILAMEHALPPTGGWGLGIDRLCMLLTDSYNIQEVILFPAMKPKDQNTEAEESENKDEKLVEN